MADTIGALIDKLTIVNLKIFKAEDLKRDPNATDKEISDATKSTNILNGCRNDLIQEIDEKLNHMVRTSELQKTYSQGSTKSYGKK